MIFVNDRLLQYKYPELYEQVVNKDHDIFPTSTKEEEWICRKCGSIFKAAPINILNRKAGCVCESCRARNWSYPEKVMYYLLQQTDIEFEPHKTFKWSDKKQYDFYLNKVNWIVETHGAQHYTEGFSNLGGLSLKEQKIVDEYKYNLAINNGINGYIIIDSRNSSINYLKEKIEQSELYSLIRKNYSKEIDWETINQKALDDIYCQVIDLWNNGLHSINEISDRTKICRNAVRNGLIRFNNLLTPTYDEALKTELTNKKRIAVLSKNNDILKIYESITSCANESLNDFGIKFDFRNISAVCRHIEKTHKGYCFRYLDDVQTSHIDKGGINV